MKNTIQLNSMKITEHTVAQFVFGTALSISVVLAVPCIGTILFFLF